MDIGSVKSQGMSASKDTSKIDNKSNSSKDIAGKSKSSATQDKLSISSEGQQLSRILSRISSGFYDNPEVLTATAERIAQELDSAK